MSQCKCGRSVYSAHTTSSQYDLCDMCSRRSEVAHAISQARADAVAQGIWPPKGGPAHLTTQMVSTIALPTAVSPLK